MTKDVNLTIYLKDGRNFSGTYAWPVAAARVEASKTFPDFLGFALIGKPVGMN